MPFTYSIDQIQKRTRVVAIGPIDIASSIQEILKVAHDPQFSPFHSVLVDLRQMDFQPNLSDVFIISDLLGSLRESFRGEITLLVTPAVLPLAQLTCTLAGAAGVRDMRALSEIEVQS